MKFDLLFSFKLKKDKCSRILSKYSCLYSEKILLNNDKFAICLRVCKSKTSVWKMKSMKFMLYLQESTVVEYEFFPNHACINRVLILQLKLINCDNIYKSGDFWSLGYSESTNNLNSKTQSQGSRIPKIIGGLESHIVEKKQSPHQMLVFFTLRLTHMLWRSKIEVLS